ncbi:oxalate:formate antiporter [Streptococcus pneumoniae]|nr:oxalate:formate antiporter [Streptococcus pneumoniae]
MKSNRYIIAFAGVILHLMLGSTYAWSVYRNPIIEKTGWDQASVAFAFSLAIFCLGLSAAFMGRLVEKFGPKVMGSLSAFLYAGGNILAGFAIDRQELWLLYLAYGILGGLGLGAGYITPVNLLFGLIGCIYGAFGRKIWSESHGESICFSIRRWKYLNRICNRPSGTVVVVSSLWHFRWAWFGSRLYYPCVNDYKMVS